VKLCPVCKKEMKLISSSFYVCDKCRISTYSPTSKKMEANDLEFLKELMFGKTKTNWDQELKQLIKEGV